MSNKDSSENLQRRKLLKNFGGAAAGIGAVSASRTDPADAKAYEKGIKGEPDGDENTNLEEINVEELEGTERNNVVKRALSDNEFKDISEDYLEKGWEMMENDVKAHKTIKPNNSFYSISMPFKTDNYKISDNESHRAHIKWTSINERVSVGHHYPEGSKIDSESDDDIKDVVISTSKNGELEKKHSSLDPSDVSAQSMASCHCTGGVDLECVAYTALVLGAGSTSCKACYRDPTRISCIACASLLIVSGWNLTSCCTECWKCCTQTWCGWFRPCFTCREYC